MYEILGLKHVFSTFQETVWSHLKKALQVKGLSTSGRKDILVRHLEGALSGDS